MRILIVNTTHYKTNGIASVIVNHIKGIRKFLPEAEIFISCFGEVDSFYKDSFTKYDVNVLRTFPRKTIWKYFKGAKKIVKNNQFDLIHIHGNSFTMIYDYFCFHCSEAKYIFHGHNTNCSHNMLHKMFRPLLRNIGDFNLACSKDAGNFTFHSKFSIIPNFFDTNVFSFNADYRKIIRKEYKIENKCVLLHIGRFNEQKNQSFLINVINGLNENFVLLLIGDGPLLSEVKNKANVLKLENVFFVSPKSDIYKYYSAADIFLFPSLYEGLGIVGVEAQYNSLPCIFSKNIPIDTIISNLVVSLPLEIQAWRNEIKYINDQNVCRKKIDVLESDFNFDIGASKLINIYKTLERETK